MRCFERAIFGSYVDTNIAVASRDQVTAAANAFLYWRLKISCPRSVTTRIAHSPECYNNAFDMFFFSAHFGKDISQVESLLRALH